MKKYQFSYSKKFKCVASACKHSCCVGWEIFVDKKTHELYKRLENSDNRFIGCFSGKNIRLNESLRCPFLDEDNLCHIIKNYGEKCISKTCKTHPRFINFFSSFIETGLGLYCEEATRIILLEKSKMKPVLDKDSRVLKPLTPFEKKILAFRKKVLNVCQDRKLAILERLKLLEQLSNINLDKKPFCEWVKLLSGLEKIPTNTDYFSCLKDTKDFSLNYKKEFTISFEQILSYLAFRHISRAIDEIDLAVRLAFIILSFKIIYELFVSLGGDFDALVEACRFYTSSVELSDENLFSMLNEIEKLVVLI